jgi:hypothetical protein
VSDFDPERILEALAEHHVDYILIGGLAAYIHGSPLLTEDVDVVPSRAESNLTRLSSALTALDARIRVDGAEPLPFSHDSTSLAASTTWNLTTKYGDLDIAFEPSGTTGYVDLVRQAVTITVGGTEAKLASLSDIVRSKDAAGRDKDRRALPVLRELLDRSSRDGQ